MPTPGGSSGQWPQPPGARLAQYPPTRLHQVTSTTSGYLQELLDHHADLFKEELGTIQGTTTKIYVDPTVQPKFCKPRPVPYALRAKVEAELECLERGHHRESLNG